MVRVELKRATVDAGRGPPDMRDCESELCTPRAVRAACVACSQLHDILLVLVFPCRSFFERLCRIRRRASSKINTPSPRNVKCWEPNERVLSAAPVTYVLKGALTCATTSHPLDKFVVVFKNFNLLFNEVKSEQRYVGSALLREGFTLYGVTLEAWRPNYIERGLLVSARNLTI
jgi:hypothetical protein